MKLKKPEPLPDLTSEVASGFLLENILIIGVDEVGRGCLAGSVVAAAAILPAEVHAKFKFTSTGRRPGNPENPDHFIFQIKDSKMIAEALRAPLAENVRSMVRGFALGEASVKEIQELNIYYASHLAMERAVNALEEKLGKKADLILVDGNVVPKEFKERGRAIIGGDQKSLSIACASIIAKVHRDELMARMDEVYPGYGFKSHKGYPTPQHKAQIQLLGVKDIHRVGFKGVG